MKNTIKEELQQFEKEYGIKIISARDTGSRAWSLQSPESDYDVSFIYLQNHQDYVNPSGYKQNIDRQTKTSHDIEYNSWNLDRYLALLKSSNPSAIEYLQSPVKYHEPEKEYLEKLETHAKQNFKPLALMMHHHQLAKSQYERYLAQRKDPTVKRHLYALRSLYCREYIKKTKKLPNINFIQFYNQNKYVAKGFSPHVSEIDRMIKNKKAGNSDKTVKNQRITKKIGSLLEQQLPDEQKPEYTQQNIDTDYLNKHTTKLIKDFNKKPCTWKRTLSTWKEHITSLKKKTPSPGQQNA